MAGFSGLPSSSSSSSNATWSGVARVKGPKWARMPLLTIGMLGLQIVWSVEMGYASPYLLSLGLSKSLMSIVFVAGPLSGLIVQPLIGVLADHSKSRFGRRRPYMLGGSLICAADRAILVDLLPPSEQELGNAWAGRMFGLGSVAGFFVGNIDLPKAIPWMGKTQLQVLSVVTSIFLMVTQGITSASVTEKVLVKEADGQGKGSFLSIFKDIWNNILTLPRVILQICIVQFFSWIAWFPVLFFSTVWVGEIYTREALAKDPSLSPDDPTLQADATRAGSRALLWSSILSLGSSILLPFLVHQSSFNEDEDEKPWANGTGRSRRGDDSWARVFQWLKSMRIHLATLWMISHLLFAITMGLTLFSTSVDNASALITLTGFSWAVTQWVPFSLLGEAILVASPPASYDPTDDAPIPLAEHRSRRHGHSSSGSAAERQQLMFNAEDQFRDDDHPRDSKDSSRRRDPEARYLPPEIRHLSSNGDVHTRIRSPYGLSNDEARISSADLRPSATPSSSRPPPTPSTSRTTSHGSAAIEPTAASALEKGRKDDSSDAESDVGSDEDLMLEKHGEGHGDGGMSNKAGIILGIHNIFVVIPQFLVTGLSSILFALLEPHKSVLDQGHAGHPAAGNVPNKNITEAASAAAAAEVIRATLEPREAPVEGSGDSIGIIFRVGGVSALIACGLCWKLSRDLVGKHR
ncbi:hypothetical protein FRC04_003859 [Tulasnella sp. 424]|nr:hypothetical protein FRC04_003859 [Tulasnella sp. 424]